MIQLTVALPIWNSPKVTAIALESLCNQKVDFKWELIIMEEQINAFGINNVKRYASRLSCAGCASLKYMAIDYRIPLPQKWKRIANARSETSKVFLLQAADCYAEPLRLKRTLEKELEGYDWIQNRKGYYYSLHYDKLILFDQNSFGKGCLTGLNMACSTSILDRLPDDGIQQSGIDNWFYRSVNPIKPCWIEEDIEDGVDLDGLNNISFARRFYFHNPKPPFVATSKTLDDILPKKICEKIRMLKVE